jgi:hypothetical protein
MLEVYREQHRINSEILSSGPSGIVGKGQVGVVIANSVSEEIES